MEHLIEFRRDRELTLQALADRIGTSPGYLHDLEKGRRRPSPALAKTIEEKTGISRRVLLPEVFGDLPAEGASE